MICDHTGLEFNTLEDLCHFYRVKPEQVLAKLHAGESLKEILEPKIESEALSYIDHVGNRYKSFKDMCKAWQKASYLVKSRLNNGWSLQDALTIKKNPTHKKTHHILQHEFLDHYGNRYQTFKDMCKAYKLNPFCVRSRLRIGWSLQDALTKPLQNKRFFSVNGERFESIAAIAKTYKKSAATIYQRLKRGWNLQDAVNVPFLGKIKVYKGKESVDHKGNHYNSFSAMCIAYDKSSDLVQKRLDRGWNLQDALTMSSQARRLASKVSYDHKGNRYDSFSAMCRAYSINIQTCFTRLRRGMSLEQALTTSKKSVNHAKKKRCVLQRKAFDHAGNRYKTFKDMCKAYKLNDFCVHARLRAGWSLQDALTKPLQNKHFVFFNGKQYESVAAICRAYNKVVNTIYKRLKRGMSLEQALIMPTQVPATPKKISR